MPSTVINLESESSSTTKEEKHSGKQEELPDFQKSKGFHGSMLRTWLNVKTESAFLLDTSTD
jgi:hypothetical protein